VDHLARAEAVRDKEIIIAGIGSSIPFGNVDHALYDVIHWVGFDAALAGSVALLREHAVFAGLSSGAAHLVARWEARRAPERRVVFVAADTGTIVLVSNEGNARMVAQLAEKLAGRRSAGVVDLTAGPSEKGVIDGPRSDDGPGLREGIRGPEAPEGRG
jgi:hypothetical protein